MEKETSVDIGGVQYDFIPDESVGASCLSCAFDKKPSYCTFLQGKFSCGDSGYFVKHETNDADGVITARIVPNEMTAEFKTDKITRTSSIGKRSYYSFPNGVEAEDICRYLSFNLGNVVKYSCRAGRKDIKKKIEDLRKAKDYLEDEIKRLEEGDD